MLGLEVRVRPAVLERPSHVGRLGRPHHRLRRQQVLPGPPPTLTPNPSQLGRAAKAASSVLEKGVQNVAENLEGALVTFGEGQADRAGYVSLGVVG